MGGWGAWGEGNVLKRLQNLQSTLELNPRNMLLRPETGAPWHLAGVTGDSAAVETVEAVPLPQTDRQTKGRTDGRTARWRDIQQPHMTLVNPATTSGFARLKDAKDSSASTEKKTSLNS